MKIVNNEIEILKYQLEKFFKKKKYRNINNNKN